MTIVARIALLCLAAGLFGCTAPRPEAATQVDSRTAAIDAIRQRYHLPALAVAEQKDGKIVAEAYTGSRKIGDPTPIGPNDEFHLGSCTKAMTATLLAMLVQDGKLSWSSTLGEIFPDVPMNAAYQKVTIDMIAAHHGGFPDNMYDERLWDSLWRADAVTGRETVARSMLNAKPGIKPGTDFLYSNVGYIILGYVIDRVSGMPWEDFIKTRLFDPLKMYSCGFGPAGNPTALYPDEPWGHVRTKKGPVARAPTRDADNPPAADSAGRVHCAFADWGKFLQLLVDGFNGKSSPLLGAKGFTKLHSTYPGDTYTYGGWVEADRSWAEGHVYLHEGSNTFSMARAWIAPKSNLIFMAATNYDTEEEGRKAMHEAVRLLRDKY